MVSWMEVDQKVVDPSSPFSRASLDQAKVIRAEHRGTKMTEEISQSGDQLFVDLDSVSPRRHQFSLE
jgi:hypothetical protein